MDKSTRLLNALKEGDSNKIGLAFTAAIREKVATALDVRKVAVVSNFYSESNKITKAERLTNLIRRGKTNGQ